MSSALARWPGLIAGSYPCQCGNSGTVIVDEDATAYCSKCTTRDEALMPLIGFTYKLPHPRVERTTGQPGTGGTDDRRRGGLPPPEPPLGPGDRSLRL